MTSLLSERRTLYSFEFLRGKLAFGIYVMPDQWLLSCDARARWKYLPLSGPQRHEKLWMLEVTPPPMSTGWGMWFFWVWDWKETCIEAVSGPYWKARFTIYTTGFWSFSKDFSMANASKVVLQNHIGLRLI